MGLNFPKGEERITNGFTKEVTFKINLKKKKKERESDQYIF